jgi:hydroxymethylglutaryl-CoA synthase
MEEKKLNGVGISQIGIEVPSTYISVEKIANKRGMDPEKASKGLKVKLARIPHRENLSELAVRAIKKIQYKDVKTFFFATESNPDATKPEIALKTLEILGLHNVLFIPTTFACVGGIQSVVAACKISAGTNEPVIVVAVDRAIYQENEPEAEVTQGSAAVAVRIEPQAELLSLDYKNIGIYTADIDDFKIPWHFYPMPQLDEKLIKVTYLHCVKQSLLDWENNNRELVESLKKEKGETVIDYLNFIDFHCPFLKFVEWATAVLWQHYKIKDKTPPHLSDVMVKPELYPQYKEKIDQIRKIPEFQKFYQQKVFSILGKYHPEIGNSYTANVFVGLISALEQARKGETIGICGFGSGAGSLAIRGIVMSNGFQSDLREQLNRGEELTMEEYKQWRERETKK